MGLPCYSAGTESTNFARRANPHRCSVSSSTASRSQSTITFPVSSMITAPSKPTASRTTDSSSRASGFTWKATLSSSRASYEPVSAVVYSGRNQDCDGANQGTTVDVALAGTQDSCTSSGGPPPVDRAGTTCGRLSMDVSFAWLSLTKATLRELRRLVVFCRICAVPTGTAGTMRPPIVVTLNRYYPVTFKPASKKMRQYVQLTRPETLLLD